MSWKRHGLLLAAIALEACGLAPAVQWSPVPKPTDAPTIAPPRAQIRFPTPRPSLVAPATTVPGQPAPEPVRAGRFPLLFPFATLRNLGVGVPGTLNIVLFDRTTADLYTIPAVNTPANEFFPSLSRTGRYMTYTTDEPGNADIYRYDAETQLIDTLPRLNTKANALRAVSSDDGYTIAFSEIWEGVTVMRLYDFRTGARYIPAAVRPPIREPLARDISPDGTMVAFTALRDGQLDVEFYALGTDEILTPPFINTRFNETTPVFGPDGTELVFVSDRNGSPDIFLIDLKTGMLDNLPLLNSPAVDADPVLLPGGNEIIFQSSRSGAIRVYIYDRATGLLDTLPTADIGFDPIPPSTPDTPATSEASASPSDEQALNSEN